MKHLIIFSKVGRRIGNIPIPNLLYLDSEKEWVQKQLFLHDKLDGVAIVIDWDKNEVTVIRHA